MSCAGLLISARQALGNVPVKPEEDTGEQPGCRLRIQRENELPGILTTVFEPGAETTGRNMVNHLNLTRVIHHRGNVLAGQIIFVREVRICRRG